VASGGSLVRAHKPKRLSVSCKCIYRANVSRGYIRPSEYYYRLTRTAANALGSGLGKTITLLQCHVVFAVCLGQADVAPWRSGSRFQPRKGIRRRRSKAATQNTNGCCSRDKSKKPKITGGAIAWQWAPADQSHMGCASRGAREGNLSRRCGCRRRLARLAGTSPLFGYMRLSE
jgi:hypothetical protein